MRFDRRFEAIPIDLTLLLRSLADAGERMSARVADDLAILAGWTRHYLDESVWLSIDDVYRDAWLEAADLHDDMLAIYVERWLANCLASIVVWDALGEDDAQNAGWRVTRFTGGTPGRLPAMVDFGSFKDSTAAAELCQLLADAAVGVRDLRSSLSEWWERHRLDV